MADFRRPLTPRQLEILRWINVFRQARGYPPTVREIADAFGFASQTGAVCHLKALQTKGWIEPRWAKGTPRTLVATESTEHVGLADDVAWMLS